MNSSDHLGAYGYKPAYGHSAPKQWQAPAEDTLRTAVMDCERKSYQLTLKENPRGRFLRITEVRGGLRANIIIPSTGLKEFQKILAEMVAEAERLPTPPPPPSPV